MTTRITVTMVAVILAVGVIAVTAFAVDLLDLEHHPLGIAAVVFAAAGGGAFVLGRWRRARRPPS
jgi:drug/metabolite transporter (DMT)-like permease